jgi:hypothetical protein
LVFPEIEMKMIFDKNMNLTVKNKKTGKKNVRSVSSIDDFFSIVNSISGDYSIELDNDLYAKLKELSVLKA